jgi:EmrB/QacA subfamily drug resistance transporter
LTAPTPSIATTRDPRRWITLAVVTAAALILVLDTSVLTVAIPTIIHDFHTTLPAVEWVITGYALVFASLLIIGGRLGDVYGHRRVFIVGAALFGSGSLLAALSWNVGSLIVGEAVIEGIGAAIMLPATLSVVSTTFEGRERATAFSVWGATVGVAVALGPVLGGFLTTNFSWRWAFGINVIVAPLAILGAVLFIHRDERKVVRTSIDVPGACLVALGMFLLVFSLSEGGRYGWFRPLEPVSVAGAEVWPRNLAVSVVPLAMLLGVVVLFAFYRLERAKERADGDPLFAFGELRHRTFRYGLVTTLVLAMGQLGVFFVLPVFLQDAKLLSAETNGFWMLPSGVAIIVGSQIGGFMARRVSTVRIVQLGLTISVAGIVATAVMAEPDMSFWQLAVGICGFGLGLGLSSSQLIGVVLSEIAAAKTGVASGANSTLRQVGSALGVAVIGSVFATLTARDAVDAVRAAHVPETLRQAAVTGIRSQGAGFRAPPGTSTVDATALHHALASGITDAVRPALLLAAGFVAVGTLLSFLLPRDVGAPAGPEPLVEALVVLEPVVPDPRVVLSREP